MMRLLIVWGMLLAGCSTQLEQEGGTPVTGVNKSNKPYYVRGSWHYPQKHYEYDQQGLASWYGPGFHGKSKASGERFNQNALTAAHKTLPLPTVVEVIHQKTGRKVVVVVDDRGPFVYAGRIIDLSVGAARALGSYGQGIAPVRVRSLVAESRALSNYLARYGSRGRTWRQVYDEEIAGQYDRYDLIPPQKVPTKKKSIKPKPPLSKKMTKKIKLDSVLYSKRKRNIQ